MAYLEIVEGDSRGKIVRLSAEIVIGRTADNGLCLEDGSVSRQHAVIRQKENYFVIIDCGSANGTFVNKRGLHRHVPQPLYEGDEIVIGSSRMLFRSEGQDPLAAKKKTSAATVTFSDAAKLARSGGLTMTFTSETRVPAVNATMDASAADFLVMREDGPQNTSSLQDAVRRLQAMVKVSQDLGALAKPEALLEKIMNSIFDIFPHADRAFIMLRDKETGKLAPAMGSSRECCGKQESGEFPVSRTIINTVIEKKQSILSSDAQRDGRFASQQSIVDLSIRSLMCAPFICKSELLGVISVDTKSSRHAFSADDLGMLTSIAGQAAIAIKNAELYTAVEKETQTRTQLSRYLSQDVVEGVLDGTIPLKLGGERKHGTVFFCDIVGFTAMSESLEALAVVELLNKYFRITTEIITRHSGTLHKFGGDMIMAFWNVMVKDNDAQANAIRASIEMQAAVWKFGCGLVAAGQPPIYVGIGCNTGEFAGGNIGGIDRMEYTIIGDNVNLAQRIESLASRWQVFVAAHTYDPASHQCCAVRLPPALVKGKSQPIQVFSVRGILLDNDVMILTVPVSVRFAPSSLECSGLLVRWQQSASQLTLCIPADVVCVEGETCHCDFDCPELGRPMSLAAQVKDIHEPQPESMECKTVMLGSVEGADATAFFKPGSLIQSHKTWDEMTRH
jgi:class 3 adenylate cyclase